MNRRGFLTAILKAGASAAMLPAAMTYVRHWKLPTKESRIYIGIYEQLKQCSTFDLARKQPLDLDAFIQSFYATRRARKLAEASYRTHLGILLAPRHGRDSMTLPVIRPSSQ